ncbi:MAG: malectin domain-containing carbohydrate-binding protein [Verrucomicrobiota bacterium]
MRAIVFSLRGSLAALMLASSFSYWPVLAAQAGQPVVVLENRAGSLSALAASEVRRYFYLRTGEWLGLKGKVPANGDAVVIARKDSPLLRDFAEADTGASQLKNQEYRIKSLSHSSDRLVLIIGGDDLGTLYGAYRFAETLGVRFYLHADVIPDARRAAVLPEVDEVGRPLFALRGVNPWGSHPFGFDAWSADDYKALCTQLTKMRMNFLGMHCYPEGLPYAEPTVWHGVTNDFDADGRVQFSYVSRYYNTLLKPGWGDFLPKKTSSYSFGAALLFERDDWAPPVLAGHCPLPVSAADCNEVFNRMGTQFRDAFQFAKQLGVKTCLGTEAPLTIPKVVQERLRAAGKNPADPAVVREIYEGTFRRIMASHPLDYYWFWTPEGWTWGDNQADQYTNTVADIRLAIEAAHNVQAPFQLATCGWVLGPAHDRAAFDRDLPRGIAMAAISRNTGHDPVDTAFARTAGRETWAIPWLESDNDLGLNAPQLYVGRLRGDAVDAKRYGCAGLMGLHWRTDILAPNVAALAQAAWDQSWKTTGRNQSRWAIDGQVANYPTALVRGTDEELVYRSCRFNMATAGIALSNGSYKVTLKFCEPHFKAGNERVFDVQLQGRSVLTNLDIHARVGQFAPLDFVFNNVAVTNQALEVKFIPRKSLPCISGIAVEGATFTSKFNCGGEAWRDWQADSAAAARDLPCGDFYADWARGNFGVEAADDIAAVFTAIDGRVPRAATDGCPVGNLSPDPTPWATLAPGYAFVDKLEALRPRVRGAGNLDRFDYWLNTFKYYRSLAQVRCAMGARQTNEVRRIWGDTYRYLIASASTPGALAALVTLENHPGALPQVSAYAPQPWPKGYQGEPRLIVPCVRSLVGRNESLALTAIALDNQPMKRATLCWRALGQRAWQTLDLGRVTRAVYRVTLPAATESFEYYLQAETDGGKRLHWPSTAPDINQTVVVMP